MNSENSNEKKEIKPISKEREDLVLRRPAKGFAYNPLLKYPRNNPCPCGKPLKYKRCCLPRLPPLVSNAEAERYSAQMKKFKILKFNFLKELESAPIEPKAGGEV